MHCKRKSRKKLAFQRWEPFPRRSQAVLEFQVEIDGINFNGVDMIKWDDEGKIVEGRYPALVK